MGGNILRPALMCSFGMAPNGSVCAEVKTRRNVNDEG